MHPHLAPVLSLSHVCTHRLASTPRWLGAGPAVGLAVVAALASGCSVTVNIVDEDSETDSEDSSDDEVGTTETTDTDTDTDTTDSSSETADTSSETGEQAPSLAGDWQPAAGVVQGLCGEEVLIRPMLTDPVAIADLGEGEYLLSFTSGCDLSFTWEAELGEAVMTPTSCRIDAEGEPGILDATFGAFTPRGADPSADEAELLIAYTVDVGSCELEYDVQLTLDAGPEPVEELAAFVPGDFLESVERDLDGNTWMVNRGPSGTGLFLHEGGQLFLVAQYPADTLGTIVIDELGDLYGTLVAPEDPNGERAIIAVEDGTVVPLALLPQDTLPNGITADLDGNLYVADSLGKVWRLEPGSNTAEIWAEDQPLVQEPGGFPGPNGIKIFEGEVYVSNPSQLSMVRTPILDDGSAGESQLYAYGVGIDDFAIDVDGNVWGTTHPFNGLVLVRPNGEVRLLHDKDDDFWGPTAAIFGRAEDDLNNLYVVTDGNAFGSVLPPHLSQSMEVSAPKLLGLDAGVMGAPIPGD